MNWIEPSRKLNSIFEVFFYNFCDNYYFFIFPIFQDYNFSVHRYLFSSQGCRWWKILIKSCPKPLHLFSSFPTKHLTLNIIRKLSQNFSKSNLQVGKFKYCNFYCVKILQINVTFRKVIAFLTHKLLFKFTTWIRYPCFNIKNCYFQWHGLSFLFILEKRQYLPHYSSKKISRVPLWI